MKRKSKKPVHNSLTEKLSSQNESQIDYTTIDLYEFSIEKCDLCDSVFYNKFNIMVHTASHIIIPLIRQNLHRCEKCKNYFPTAESVELHNLNDHLNITNKTDYNREVLESFIRKEPYTLLVKEKFVLQNNTENVNVDVLNGIDTMQPVTLLTEEPEEPLVSEKETDSGQSVLQSLVEREAVTLLEPLVTKVEVINLSDGENGQDSLDSKSSNNSNKSTIKIKDRILFEDEDFEFMNNNVFNDSSMDDSATTSSELLSHLTTDCRVNIDTLNGYSDSNSTKEGFRRNAIILGKYPCDNVHGNSVHYDDLVMSELCRCKKCGETFPNRYEMIVHETNHIRFKRRAPILCRMCDWYIGNSRWALQKHQCSKHPDRVAPTTEPTVCRTCGLRYIFFYRHMRNYHNMYVCKAKDCTMKFTSKYDYQDHRVVHDKKDYGDDSVTVKTDWNSKTLKVCELCYSFLKNTSNIHYKLLSALSEIGVRYKCDRCENKYFELKLVKVDVRKRKHRDEIVRKNKCNEDRLKSLQLKLKKLKLLNKY